MGTKVKIAHGSCTTVNDVWRNVYHAVLTIAQIERKINEYRKNPAEPGYPVRKLLSEMDDG